MTRIRAVLNYFSKKKEVINASWLIIGRVVQMILSFVVGIFTARFLGPSNYGLINYGLAFVTFFVAFCNLGINSILVKEIVDSPEESGTILGTTCFLRFLSSVLCSVLIGISVWFIDYGESQTIIVVIICSISLIFQIPEVFNYWFQAHYQSKITAITSLISYSITSIYKIILLILKMDVKWFAFANTLDYIVYGAIIVCYYKKYKGPKLKICLSKGKMLLSKSYHFILSSAMIAVYMQTDKLMLKQMLTEAEVGYYSIANNICNMWVFVLAAIIDSMNPTIFRLYENKEYNLFTKTNKRMYCIVFYLSCIVSMGFLILGKYVVLILYGKSYSGAIGPLLVLTWYTAFSYLGVARNSWLVCKNAQKYLKYLYIGAAIINVVLNYCLIPIFGATGAAIASLITQVATSLIFPSVFRETRENAKLMLEAIVFKGIK